MNTGSTTGRITQRLTDRCTEFFCTEFHTANECTNLANLNITLSYTWNVILCRGVCACGDVCIFTYIQYGTVHATDKYHYVNILFAC